MSQRIYKNIHEEHEKLNICHQKNANVLMSMDESIQDLLMIKLS
jgi:hypothetical protein